MKSDTQALTDENNKYNIETIKYNLELYKQRNPLLDDIDKKWFMILI